MPEARGIVLADARKVLAAEVVVIHESAQLAEGSVKITGAAEAAPRWKVHVTKHGDSPSLPLLAVQLRS